MLVQVRNSLYIYLLSNSDIAASLQSFADFWLLFLSSGKEASIRANVGRSVGLSVCGKKFRGKFVENLWNQKFKIL